jgi:hypothetical protein
LDERVLVRSEGDQEAEKVVEVLEVEGVGEGTRFNDEQTLKGMYDFLNLFPLVRELLNFSQVAHQDLIDPFVLLDEDEEQVVSSLSDFGLNATTLTFSSERRAMACSRS